MDAKHADQLKEGVEVVVKFGSVLEDIQGTPPIVTTAVCRGPVEGFQAEVFNGQRWWFEVDVAEDTTIPQMYSIDEVVGFLLPMAKVTHAENGVTYGTLPEDYVGP